MAAKPEVLITSLLLQIETSFQSSWYGVTKLAACTWPLPLASDTIACWISKMAGNNRKWW